jgi:hypothetical protein
MGYLDDGNTWVEAEARANANSPYPRNPGPRLIPEGATYYESDPSNYEGRMPGHWVWTRPGKALTVLVTRLVPACLPACLHLHTSARPHARTPWRERERERKREKKEREERERREREREREEREREREREVLIESFQRTDS